MDTPVTGAPIRWSGIRELLAQTLFEIARFTRSPRQNWVPPQGENRITGMVLTQPDWVVSRQRAWGVPITVFRHKETGKVIPGRDFNASGELIDAHRRCVPRRGCRRLVRGGRQRALPRRTRRQSERIGRRSTTFSTSGSTPARTHAFVLEKRRRTSLGRPSLYLEGSDQHRGWFQSSLLEACGTRGRAPLRGGADARLRRSTRTGARCRSRSAMSWRRKT